MEVALREISTKAYGQTHHQKNIQVQSFCSNPIRATNLNVILILVTKSQTGIYFVFTTN